MQVYLNPDIMKKCPKDLTLINLKEETLYQVTQGPSLVSPELLFESKDKSVSYCFRKLIHMGPEEYQLLERVKFHGKYTPLSLKCLMLVRKTRKGQLIFPFTDARFVYELTGSASDLTFTLSHGGEPLGTVKKDKAKFTVKYKEKNKETEKEEEKEKEVEKETFILETKTKEGMPFFAAAVIFIHFICHGSFT